MSSSTFKRRMLAVALAGGLAASVSISTAEAHGTVGPVEPVVEFNPEAGEFPEGVAVDRHGNVFASLTPLGQVVKIPRGTNTPEFFGSVPGFDPFDPDREGFGLLGLTVDRRGNVYGAMFDRGATNDTTGVSKFDRRTGEASLVPGTDAIFFPNAVAFDKFGNLFVTETSASFGEPTSRIWRVPRNGSAEVWVESELLNGTGLLLGFPLGANGIAVRHRTVYVGVTDQSSIVKIPIRWNGSAGTPRLLADELPFPVDGIALDIFGNVYYASPADPTDPTAFPPGGIVKVSRRGTTSTVLATGADGLDGPTSVAFGNSWGDRRNLYAVNFAFRPPGFPEGLPINPSLVKLDVGIPGQRVP